MKRIIISIIFILLTISIVCAQSKPTKHLLPKNSIIFASSLEVMHWIDLKGEVSRNYLSTLIEKKRAFLTNADQEVIIVDEVDYKGIKIVKVRNTDNKAEAWTPQLSLKKTKNTKK